MSHDDDDTASAPKYKPSDEVVCKIKNNDFVYHGSKVYDFIDNFEIISKIGREYYVFIPSRYCINDAININQDNCQRYSIQTRFVDSKVARITEDNIVRLYRRMDGAVCNRCEEFFNYAEPNSVTGSFVCYSCKQNPYR